MSEARATAPATNLPVAAALVGVSVVYSLGSIFDLFPHGVEGEWDWAYHVLDFSGALFVPVAIAGALVAVLALNRRGRLGTTGFLCASAALGMAWVVSFYYAYPEQMTHAVLAILHPDSTGYFQAALRFPELGDVFSPRYASMLADLPNHANTRLPGPLLVFWSAIHFIQAHPDLSAALSRALPMLGVDAAVLYRIARVSPAHVQAAFAIAVFYAAATAASVWPVHALARRLAGPEVAAWSVPLWLFTPALAAFYPTFDPTYPAASAAIVWALVGGVEDRRPGLLILASLLTAAASFFTFAFAAVVAWGGLYYVAWAFMHQKGVVSHAREHLLVVACCALPFALAYLALAVFGHISVIEVFAQGVSVTQGVMARLSYLRWVLFFTWYDFFTFSGLVVSLFFFAHVRATIAGLRSGAAADTPEQRNAPLVFAYLIVLVMLVVSGNTIAEVARLWIFLMPTVTIFGTCAALRMTPAGHPLRWAIVGAAALQSFVFQATYGVLIDGRAGL